MKILIVDDDPDILNLVAQALAALGDHDVDTAASGRAALDKVSASIVPFDCFLLDIQMPQMTGIELCGHIRSRPGYRYTPVIMVTAASDKDHIDQAFAAGATDYLTKPFDIFDLKHRIALAEKSAFQTRQMAQDVYQLNELQEDLQAEAFHSLEDAIPIDDVDGVLRVHAFESYLKHMNRTQYNRTKLLSVVTLNIRDIYDRCTGREFADQVADIAESIVTALHGKTPLITYLGRGVYIVAVEADRVANTGALLSEIKAAVHALGMIYRNGDPVDVQVDVLEITKPGNYFSAANKIMFIENLVSSWDGYRKHVAK